MSAKGITAYEKLIYNGINIETGERLTEDFAKKISMDALNHGRVWIERSGLDYEKFGKIADDVMLLNLDVYENTVKDIENKCVTHAYLIDENNFSQSFDFVLSFVKAILQNLS